MQDVQQKLQDNLYVIPYHYLDLALEEYKWVYSVEYLTRLNNVVSLLEADDRALILDAGCGDGRLCFELRKMGYRVVGVDFSEQAIGFAKVLNPDVEFFVQDLAELDLPYQFSAAVLMETLEHIIPEKVPVVLEKLVCHLKPGGRLIITVPSQLLPLSPKHYQHFSPEKLEAILSPLVTVKQILGYAEKNTHYYVFKYMRKIATVLFPVGKKLSGFYRYLAWLRGYYERYVAIGDPYQSLGLIAVCEKE